MKLISPTRMVMMLHKYPIIKNVEAPARSSKFCWVIGCHSVVGDKTPPATVIITDADKATRMLGVFEETRLVDKSRRTMNSTAVIAQIE